MDDTTMPTDPQMGLDPEEQGRVAGLLAGAMAHLDLLEVLELVQEFRDRPWFPALFEMVQSQQSQHKVPLDRLEALLDEPDEEDEWESETTLPTSELQ